MSLGTTSSTCICLSNAGLQAMSTYNLIVLNDFSSTSEVELNSIVCGSLSSPGSAGFGSHWNGPSFPGSGFSLEVNGQIKAPNGINVNGGSAAFGCGSGQYVTQIDSVKYNVSGQIVSINDHGRGAIAELTCDLEEKCRNLLGAVQTLSTELSLLISDVVHNEVQLNDQQNTLKFIVNAADCNGVAAFNMRAAEVLGRPNLQISVINNTQDLNLVVINLSDENVVFQSSVGMIGAWLTSSDGRERIIWNLHQALNLDLQKGIYGALLAPKAIVSPCGGYTMEGVTVVKSMVTQAEIHHPYIKPLPCVS